MAAIADFSDDLFGGLLLVLLSLVLGGLACALFVLRPSQSDSPMAGRPVDWAVRLIAAGAAAFVPVQLAHLALKAAALAQVVGHPVYSEFLATDYARAALVQTALAGAAALASLWLAAAPRSLPRWGLVAALALAMAASGAWLSHGASRFEDRALLMALTALHTLAAAVWVGGVAFLALMWRIARSEPRYRDMWPLALRRFSVIGLASVVTIAVSALPIGVDYIADLGGLLGTGYGSMVLTKTALLALALGLALLNFRAAAAAASGGQSAEPVRARTPHIVEAEFLVLVVLLLTAASLSSQPPAIDITKERATIGEVLNVFAPRLPKLTTPSIAEMPGHTPTPLEIKPGVRTVGDEWSEFNHNLSGLIVALTAIAALLSRVKGFGWCRHWPLGFVLLAGMLLLRSDPETWPMGPVPFLESLKDAEVLQHRVAMLVALALGLLEWRARAAPRPGSRLPYVFPVLAAVGGVLLLTHSHTAFEIKSQFLVQVSHTAMGFLAVIVAGGRWLELRLRPPAAAMAGISSSVAMLLIGLILIFYRETIY